MKHKPPRPICFSCPSLAKNASDDSRRCKPLQSDLALVLAVIALAATVLMKDISVGGFRYGDAAVHAMDGVLIHDWVASGPEAWKDPVGFAERQYSHYPSLGIGKHYPPGYALVEAGFFAVMGVSIVSARLCVVFFGVMAAVGTYVFVRFWWGRPAAFLAACALISMPAITTWGRQNMLEVPTLCALIWAGVCLNAYLERPNPARLGLLLIAGMATLFFKQPAIFGLGAATATLCLLAIQKRIPTRHALVAALFSIATLIALVLSLDHHGAAIVSKGFGASDTGARALTFYARMLPGETGLAVILLSIVGGVLCARKRPTLCAFLLTSFLMCYAMLTIVTYKNHRFFCIGLLPFAAFGGIAAEWLLNKVRAASLREGAIALAVFATALAGLMRPVESRPDYGPVVEANRDRIEGHAVLVDCLRDGDFVFAVREKLAWRSTIVIRSSKLLYTCMASTFAEFRTRVANLDDVAKILGQYNLSTAFVEREDRLDLEENRLLRQHLRTSGDYSLVHSYPFQDEWIPGAFQITLDLYERVAPWESTDSELTIYLPRAKRAIAVDLSEFLPKNDGQ